MADRQWQTRREAGTQSHGPLVGSRVAEPGGGPMSVRVSPRVRTASLGASILVRCWPCSSERLPAFASERCGRRIRPAAVSHPPRQSRIPRQARVGYGDGSPRTCARSRRGSVATGLPHLPTDDRGRRHDRSRALRIPGAGHRSGQPAESARTDASAADGSRPACRIGRGWTRSSSPLACRSSHA